MKLYLKKIDMEDIPFLNNVRNQYAEKYLHDSRIFTLEQSYLWYLNSGLDYWILMDDNNRIGYFRLTNYSHLNNNIMVGLDISPEYRGQGYAKKGYKLMLDYLFYNRSLHKVSLEVLSNNDIAKNLYKKIGFIEEGIKREEVCKNGIWVDSIIMSILETEYKKIKYENN